MRGIGGGAISSGLGGKGIGGGDIVSRMHILLGDRGASGSTQSVSTGIIELG
jgi:hypothetical protein